MKTYTFENGPIQKLSWGKFTVWGKEHYKTPDGRIIGAGKDIRIYKNKISPWKERKGHYITSEMITGVDDCDILVIGKGINGAITLSDDVYKSYKNLIVENTPQACKIFNELYQKGENVALLAHGTC